jgi:DNA invertase Pin-like site-specific DNA recombinase
MNAAIYCRRSTDEQGASLDDQEAEGRGYAEARGWSVVAVYRESASGFKPGTPRPALDRMMAEAGSFDALVVWRLNRLSCQEGADSALAAVWNLRKLGVEVTASRSRAPATTWSTTSSASSRATRARPSPA